ncbi:MAG: sigma-70 family RNA polymerase sigma factor [Phycisphaerales bacterium]|nr:sigma-70 family RNA polymerase sigma factor [Phycisphaerales bacterium]
MSEPAALSAFLTRASGDDPRERDRAYGELVRWVRIVVRAEMGRRLRDHRESADVCQSIAKSFVDDFEGGHVRFDNERALAGYLRLAVRNKLAELARMDGALKRGGGVRAISEDDARPLAEGDTEERTLAGAGWERLRGTLTDEDRHLAELRMRGLEWETIGEQLGTNAAAARQRFSRIVRRLREDASPDL